MPVAVVICIAKQQGLAERLPAMGKAGLCTGLLEQCYHLGECLVFVSEAEGMYLLWSLAGLSCHERKTLLIGLVSAYAATMAVWNKKKMEAKNIH